MTDTQPDTAPLLRVHNLTAGYGPAQALFGVSLDVPARSAVAVLGPNGAGKSTLARALSGLIPTTGGSVEFAGRTITGASATRFTQWQSALSVSEKSGPDSSYPACQC